MLHALQVTDAVNVAAVVGVETTVVAIHVPPAPFNMQQFQLAL